MECGDVAVPRVDVRPDIDELTVGDWVVSDLVVQVDPNLNVLEGELGAVVGWVEHDTNYLPSCIVHTYSWIGLDWKRGNIEH